MFYHLFDSALHFFRGNAQRLHEIGFLEPFGGRLATVEVLRSLLPQRLDRLLLGCPLEHQPPAVDVGAVAKRFERLLGLLLGKELDEGEASVRPGHLFRKTDAFQGSESFKNVSNFFFVGFEGNVATNDFARCLEVKKIR